MFKTWKEAFAAQSATACSYDNGFNNPVSTGVSAIDDLPFRLGDIVWLIMAENYHLEDYHLEDYEESATEYGIKADGTWCAVYDGHCSCYGWEAGAESITEYDSLDQLLKADAESAVITKHWGVLLGLYPFLTQPGDDNQNPVIQSILSERQRQDEKWGEQNHPPMAWMGILGEEFGELCQAVNETHFNNGPEERAKGGYANMRAEAVQVAAVAVQFIEALDRRYGGEEI